MDSHPFQHTLLRPGTHIRTGLWLRPFEKQESTNEAVLTAFCCPSTWPEQATVNHKPHLFGNVRAGTRIALSTQRGGRRLCLHEPAHPGRYEDVAFWDIRCTGPHAGLLNVSVLGNPREHIAVGLLVLSYVSLTAQKHWHCSLDLSVLPRCQLDLYTFGHFLRVSSASFVETQNPDKTSFMFLNHSICLIRGHIHARRSK